MSTFRELLTAKILESRPNIHEQTVRSYVATLVNLPAKVNPKLSKEMVEKLKPDWYTKNMVKVKDYLMANVTDNRRRSILSAIFILTSDPGAREQMIADSSAVIERYKSGTMSEVERESWKHGLKY